MPDHVSFPFMIALIFPSFDHVVCNGFGLVLVFAPNLGLLGREMDLREMELR